MRDEGFLLKTDTGNNSPYQKYISSGHFTTKMTEMYNGNHYMQTMISPKGMNLVLKRLHDRGIVDSEELLQVKENVLTLNTTI